MRESLDHVIGIVSEGKEGSGSSRLPRVGRPGPVDLVFFVVATMHKVTGKLTMLWLGLGGAAHKFPT